MKIRIGTRSSNLAIAQSHKVIDSLKCKFNLRDTDFVIVPIQTTGDRIKNKNLRDIGGKSLFTKEIEDALIASEIDLAVHSMKDMPAVMPDSLVILAVLEREDPRDALISNFNLSLNELKSQSLIGTSSPRRSALLLNLRPDLKIVPFRGNVDTRLNKLQKNFVDATILAVAGLKRLGIEEKKYSVIPEEQMLPAVAQGAIGIQTRINDTKINEMVLQINHQESKICIDAERKFLSILGANCNTPIAALAKIKNNQIYFRGLVASMDGKKVQLKSEYSSIEDASKIAEQVARNLL